MFGFLLGGMISQDHRNTLEKLWAVGRRAVMLCWNWSFIVPFVLFICKGHTVAKQWTIAGLEGNQPSFTAVRWHREGPERYLHWGLRKGLARKVRESLLVWLWWPKMVLGRGKAMVIGLWQEVQLFPPGPKWPSVSWSRATLRRLSVNQGSSNTAVRDGERPRGSRDSRGLHRLFMQLSSFPRLCMR